PRSTPGSGRAARRNRKKCPKSCARSAFARSRAYSAVYAKTAEFCQFLRREAKPLVECRQRGNVGWRTVRISRRKKHFLVDGWAHAVAEGLLALYSPEFNMGAPRRWRRSSITVSPGDHYVKRTRTF